MSPSCPSSSSSCTTINDLVFPAEGDINLVFSPGTHSLEGALVIHSNVSMIGTSGETTIECPTGSSNDMVVDQVDSVNIANITFSGCKLGLTSNNVHIVRSDFLNAIFGTLVISSSSNVKIDHVTVSNNTFLQDTSSTIVQVSDSKNIEITSSVFTENVVSTRSSQILEISTSSNVKIDQVTFSNNSITADLYGKLMSLTSCRDVEFTSSSFISLI